jgi:hydroxymethylpyrimidine/phosphomethylpyrimidine kinase
MVVENEHMVVLVMVCVVVLSQAVDMVELVAVIYVVVMEMVVVLQELERCLVVMDPVMEGQTGAALGAAEPQTLHETRADLCMVMVSNPFELIQVTVSNLYVAIQVILSGHCALT